MLQLIKKKINFILNTFKTADEQANLSISIVGGGKKSTDKIPKIIWIFWHNMNHPRFVQVCIEQVKQLNPDYEVNILDLENYKLFLPEIDYDDFVCKGIQHFADLLRVCLIATYGGIWMDASVICFRPFSELLEGKSNLICYSPGCTNDDKYPILENWFLASAPNNVFFVAWSNELLELFKIKNYDTEYYQKFHNFEQLRQRIGEANYFVAFVAAQKALRDKFDLINLNVVSSYLLGFQYAIGYKGNYEQIDCNYALWSIIPSSV